jgi:peptide/nickel transport system ATP-binding protein
MNQDILRVNDLQVHYRSRKGVLKAVDHVGFSLRKGEKFGLVGESGSGKSTLVLAMLRLIKPPGQIAGGEVYLDGVDLMKLSDEEMRHTRLSNIALIPQAAMNALNPVLRIKQQFRLAMRDHGDISSDWESRVVELLDWVGLKPEVANMYPHQLSGGMKQRVCIAMGISLKPKVILADEPTSALDVVVQRRVMETLEAVQARLGATVLLVGHDMGLMAQVVDRIGVMYGGKLVEIGNVSDIFQEPLHPYTQMLIASLPSLESKGQLSGIPGLPLSLANPPSGCLFHPRCPHIMDRCSVDIPTLKEIRPGHWASCHLYESS